MMHCVLTDSDRTAAMRCSGCHASPAVGLRPLDLLARLPRGQALLHRLRHRPQHGRGPQVHGELVVVGAPAHMLACADGVVCVHVAGCHAAAACGLRPLDLLELVPRRQALLHRLRHRPQHGRVPQVHGELIVMAASGARRLSRTRHPQPQTP
eukprot:3941289-Rhodomonas_salina.1